LLTLRAKAKKRLARDTRRDAPFKPLVLGFGAGKLGENFIDRSLDWAIRQRFLDLVLVINI
jgi:hypothetical protein